MCPARVALTENDFIRLVNLLDILAENSETMTADIADGFMTGLVILPHEIKCEQWIREIIDFDSIDSSFPIKELQSLLWRRYQEIHARLLLELDIDPILLNEENEAFSYEQLEGFAFGFFASCQLSADLIDSADPEIIAAMLSFFRYLPKEIQEEISSLKEICQRINSDFPITSMEEAIIDMSIGWQQIASKTKKLVFNRKKNFAPS